MRFPKTGASQFEASKTQFSFSTYTRGHVFLIFSVGPGFQRLIFAGALESVKMAVICASACYVILVLFQIDEIDYLNKNM